MKALFLIFLIGIAGLHPLHAQIQETFSDGDFTQNPAWVGDADQFQVNTAKQLQSKGPAVTNTVLQLATANQLAVGAQWEFYVQLALATSSGNFAEVHLTSDSPDLKGGSKGYFVRMGGTEDEVSLYRKDGTTSTRIINGPDKTIAAADNKFWVRITRTAAGSWTLELDVNPTRQNYVTQGTVQDVRYLTSAYAGVLFKYSQANAQKFFFDEFTVKDVGVPALVSVVATGNRTVDLTFSEPITNPEAGNPANYRLNGTSSPVTAEWQQATPTVVRLQFGQDFETGSNALTVLRAVDRDGNLAQNLAGTFSFSPTALKGDVIITEIYADTNPLQDLPSAEFIEIYNRSSKTFNLKEWRYSDATAAFGSFPSYLLRPGAYVLVCAAADTSLYKSFGPVVGLTSFPSLNDSGDDVELFNASGQLVDMVRYSSSWYRDTQKREGGWSLERVDVNSRCSGASQWQASEHPAGGTPGQPNSIQRVDATPPVLQQAFVMNSTKILLQFNEPLDSAQAVNTLYYIVSPGVPVQQVRVLGTELNQVEITLAAPLKENERYTITTENLQDCAGNRATTAQQATVILPAQPKAGDIVINEILFNPKTGGADFVELVNRSTNYLDLQNWKLANRESSQVANAKAISSVPLVIGPGEYLVLTTSIEQVMRDYPAGKRERFQELASLPSFPDAGGTAVLLLPDGTVSDEVTYQSEQHFKLLQSVEGISLERISLSGPSVASNFHSAATQVGATPGYLNSQARGGESGSGLLTLLPKVFTPDGDGVDDVLLLQFRPPQAGYTATVNIFDANGRLVRKLAGNTLLGTETLLQWDGLTDSGTKAAIGYYIVLVELFNLQGRKEILKETTVVGGRF
ncbi:MAG: lamin tail domain-containing protein [Rufibacter sp.]